MTSTAVPAQVPDAAPATPTAPARVGCPCRDRAAH